MRAHTVVVALLGLALVASPSQATNKSEQIKALQQEITQLKERLGALESKTSEQLAEAITKLDKRISELERRIRQQAARQRVKTQGDPALEQQAMAKFNEINAQASRLEISAANANLREFFKKYSGTRLVGRARAVESELSVVGLDAPQHYEVEKWFQGKDAVQLTSNKPTLLIFWEVWCPHCRREVPKIQKLYETYGPKGLQVVGLTKVNRNKTDADVEAFLKQNNVTYPIAKEKGSVSGVFKVRGIPAAAIVKDGKIVWRGHPAHLSKEMLEKLL